MIPDQTVLFDVSNTSLLYSCLIDPCLYISTSYKALHLLDPIYIILEKSMQMCVIIYKQVADAETCSKMTVLFLVYL